MTEQEARIIVAMANNKLSALQAAESLNYHKNTVYYHIQNIKKYIGLDPHDFFDMQELYRMAEEVLRNV